MECKKIRTLYQEGNLEILLNQMENFDWEVLGISETHWTDSGQFISQGYKIIYAQVTIQPTGQEYWSSIHTQPKSPRCFTGIQPYITKTHYS